MVDEIQSAYKNVTQVTLHPILIYHINVADTLENRSYVAISDELSNALSTILALCVCITKKLFLEEIHLPNSPEIRYVHFWTDSPTSQY